MILHRLATLYHRAAIARAKRRLARLADVPWYRWRYRHTRRADRAQATITHHRNALHDLAMIERERNSGHG